MKFQPYHDNVLVKCDEAESVSPGGIIIPGNVQEKPQRGVVVAVGEGRMSDDTWIDVEAKVDDHVLFGKYSGTEIEINNTRHIILRDGDILGVFNQ